MQVVAADVEPRQPMPMIMPVVMPVVMPLAMNRRVCGLPVKMRAAVMPHRRDLTGSQSDLCSRVRPQQGGSSRAGVPGYPTYLWQHLQAPGGLLRAVRVVIVAVAHGVRVPGQPAQGLSE